MNFIDEFMRKTTEKESENGGLVYSTTSNPVLDLFASIGGMRKRDELDVISMWLDARNIDKELADKIILYTRDIRQHGGLGERKLGRILMKELAKVDPPKVCRNFQTFVDIGRWDDLFAFFDTPCEEAMIDFIKKQLKEDIINMKTNSSISLVSKWMPSINTSSKKTKMMAKRFCRGMSISEKSYRKMLSSLRKYIDVVERKMSDREWDKINFENVPSYAMMRYQSAFSKHCGKNFIEYKGQVESGEKKINSSTLYPYDLILRLKDVLKDNLDSELLNAQWKSQPDYFKEGKDIIVCADVSGSMGSLYYNYEHVPPIAVSLGLALYCAYFNKGKYHGYYLTFTDKPHFYHINEKKNLFNNVCDGLANIGYNTNMDGMFEAIFEMAKKTGDSPEALVIVSDMEIDRYMRPNRCDNIVDKWVKKFHDAGLNCPKLILWNAESRQNTYLTRSNNPYVSFISGASAGAFSQFTNLINYDAEEAMIKILNQYEYI